MVVPSRQLLLQTNVLLVGAGGIGCEVLKNLVLSGFGNIDVIDLDTIDVSNLNRQFLFQRQHVGRPKAEVAAETAREFNPDAKIRHFHASIHNPDYDVNFFKQYDLILNALDNRAARNHVNRMCLAANVPLIESGSAGYLGQVTVIKKGITECYECQPKAPQKSFPGCTIRNTPSEPIHCVVWAKHLFNQLFGEAGIDEEVSPDVADPELQGTVNGHANNGENGANLEVNGTHTYNSAMTIPVKNMADIQRVSTRGWAVEHAYDPRVLFQKLFHDDIQYLLSMDKLWKKRKPPTPLTWNGLEKLNEVDSTEQTQGAALHDQKLWSLFECRETFEQSVLKLKLRIAELPQGSCLTWDKDDVACMDFVASCANLRAFAFSIHQKTRFDIKSMAGNIIPAIATTNAIIAGVMIIEAYKLLSEDFHRCKTTYLVRGGNPRNRLLVPSDLVAPNPKCYVCSAKPEVIVCLDTKNFTVKMLEEKVLKQTLHMIAPDVEIFGTGTILISSEEGETEDLASRNLSDFHIGDGATLSCDDFLQQYNLRLIIKQTQGLPKDKEFEILTDISDLKAVPEESLPSTSQGAAAATVPEDDVILCAEPDSTTPTVSTKGPAKKRERQVLPDEPQDFEAEAKRQKIFDGY